MQHIQQLELIDPSCGPWLGQLLQLPWDGLQQVEVHFGDRDTTLPALQLIAAQMPVTRIFLGFACDDHELMVSIVESAAKLDSLQLRLERSAPDSLLSPLTGGVGVGAVSRACCCCISAAALPKACHCC